MSCLDCSNHFPSWYLCLRHLPHSEETFLDGNLPVPFYCLNCLHHLQGRVGTSMNQLLWDRAFPTHSPSHTPHRSAFLRPRQRSFGGFTCTCVPLASLFSVSLPGPLPFRWDVYKSHREPQVCCSSAASTCLSVRLKRVSFLAHFPSRLGVLQSQG